MQIKRIKKIFLLGLSMLLISTFIVSCVETNDETLKDKERYVDAEVNSYDELFNLFWVIMDQNYNYFFEQKRDDGLDWDAVYQKYSPKFKDLKTFGRVTDDDKQIKKDFLLAKQYYTEIVNPIIDRHFGLSVSIPFSKDSTEYDVSFRGGMLNKNIPKRYDYQLKVNYMQDRFSSGIANNNKTILGGYLQSNPDIYYFTFYSFMLYLQKIDTSIKYLSPDKGNGYLITEEYLKNSQLLKNIKDAEIRNKTLEISLKYLNEWNQFPQIKEIEEYNKEIEVFKNKEIITDRLIELFKIINDKFLKTIDYRNASLFDEVSSNNDAVIYRQWFMGALKNHVEKGYLLADFFNQGWTFMSVQVFYEDFLNKLSDGTIKKLILDLRSNGGGAVVDARFFVDRLITKNTVFAYQRTKEGSGRFNYTPWVPLTTQKHKFGIPKDIPIAILTDAGSASMSEITTLMLRSQGKQVASIGDYSAGATAGLGSGDDFNGGANSIVTNRLGFYMPLLATKDADGVVVEGIGIKPNIIVSPLTDDEINQMRNSPKTFNDRVINAAIDFLNKSN